MNERMIKKRVSNIKRYRKREARETWRKKN